MPDNPVVSCVKRKGETQMKVYNVGDKVKTKWDDSAKPIPAVILNKYRGHRQMRYTVRMKDETIERIDHDQIV
jgi:hypothetical protein